MKSFIEGTIELDKNVHDLVEYENARRAAIQDLLDFADGTGLEFQLGTSEDDTYMIQYKIIGKTYTYCNGILVELKAKLRQTWRKIRVTACQKREVCNAEKCDNDSDQLKNRRRYRMTVHVRVRTDAYDDRGNKRSEDA